MTRVPHPCRVDVCEVVLESPKARASHERIHRTTPAARLAARLDHNGPIPAHAPELGPCWVWTGHTVGGYGRMVVDGVSRGIHRIALAEELGRPLLPGLDACHRCDNPPCGRPSHLFEATDLENIQDRNAKGRTASGESSGRARLTADTVAEIRRRLKGGQPWSSLAGEFGVGKGTIQAIASGRTWQHVA